MDKQELGAFLRSRRERLRPQDVGLPPGPRRRTPGLRREEVAVVRHDVRGAPVLTKTFRHPAVGEVQVDCDALALPDSDQNLVLYSAPAGSPSADALALLSILGSDARSSAR